MCSLSSLVVVGTDLFPKKWEADCRGSSKQRMEVESRYCTDFKVIVVTAVLYMYVNNILQ